MICGETIICNLNFPTKKNSTCPSGKLSSTKITSPIANSLAPGYHTQLSLRARESYSKPSQPSLLFLASSLTRIQVHPCFYHVHGGVWGSGKEEKISHIIAVPVCVLSYIVTFIGFFIGVHKSTK